MDQEILRELTKIGDLLLLQAVILCVILMVALAYFAKPWLVQLIYNAQDRAVMKRDFYYQAPLLQKKGKFRELLDLSDERLLSRTNDLTAKWYRAVSLYVLGDHEEALSEFLDIQERRPAGLEDDVEEYIADLRSKINRESESP